MKKLVLIAALFAASHANAAVVLSGTGTINYSQNFDTLATGGAANVWTNDSTLTGWFLFNKSNAAVTTYAADNGSSNTGSFYSFGASAGAISDRALGGTASGGAYFGSPASGTVAGYIAAAFTNSTGVTLNSVTLGFDGEQWRNGGNTSAQAMVLQYGFGSSFASVVWTVPGGNFDWSSPVIGSTAATVNGNAAGLASGKGGTLSNLSWDNNSTLWVRWVENNDVGNDHGLAIDNFTLSVNAITTTVPESDTSAMILAGLGLMGFMARRRK